VASQTVPVEVKSETKSEEKLIPINVMDRRYMVPENLTIMKALEYAGYQLTRGCGCRGGICGACGTVYRMPDSHRIEVALACQTIVKEEMFLSQIPFFPRNKAIYDLDKIEPEQSTLSEFYPEIFKCIGCGTCTRSCPQDIEVMDYVAYAIRGEIQKVAELSFDCVMCGLCIARCPAEEAQPLVAILARRIYAKHIAPKAKHLSEQVTQIENGHFDKSLKDLMKFDTEKLKELYVSREKEPELPDPDWEPEDKSHL
jgi:heterodisulfide reductase subunit C